MLNKAFNIVSSIVDEALTAQGFVKVKADSTNDNEMVSLFTSDTIAYSVVYYKDKMHMVMRQCTMTEDGPDNEWKTMATWMFNPETDTEKEAKSIGNDFADAVRTPTAIKRQKTTKKKAKSGENSTDPIFLSKRLVTLFPELKEEIKEEEDSYYPFRGVTFANEHICPKVNDLIKKGSKKDIEKLMQILSNQYSNGNIDTRSIVTIVILNSIDPQYDGKIKEYMSDDLKKAFEASVKYRNKDVSPERPKKKKRVIGTRL